MSEQETDTRSGAELPSPPVADGAIAAPAAPPARTAPANDVISPVMITCPSTGEAVQTVLRLRAAAFDALRGDYSFRCTRCGQVHQWRKEEAWLKRPAAAKPAA